MQLRPSSDLTSTNAVCLSNDCVTQDQALLLDHPRVWFEKSTTINPVALLPDDNLQVLITIMR